LRFQAVLGENDFGAAEAVGLDNIGARLVISAVHVCDDIGAREDKVFIAAFKGGSAEVCGGELTLLQHGSHGSVEHENTCGQRVFEGLAANPPLLVKGR
jgi:hypothetical protein